MAICFDALLLLALQQSVQATGNTSPPSGDTVGYWQQRIAYTIKATLDERAQKVRATGTLNYVNNSPDTLRVMYFHQYLNAFRPHSKWSEDDEREGRERFQNLQDPDYGYERFTAPVRVNGIAVPVDYPGTPDSTVARIQLPAPLAPHDSVLVAFEWDARPSTTPRRQGRRGRHWDLAQWYPKVAVYDRGGWEYNALRPAGEFYGEFGTYDVMLVLAQEQVIGATGVPVSGDPGWSRAIRGGSARSGSNAYGAMSSSTSADLPSGFKAVRFVARDVHHFAWSASPDYRYEGGVYVRPLPNTRWPTWDTVSVHVLYRAGDDTTWGGLRVVGRTVVALRWLESIYGPYAYPQMTVLHRLDGGGTEFPMMQMNGSPSQGLILHEGGHVFTYGILANNEWRSGWMDEGFTSYQTAWAQSLTPQERVRAGIEDRFVPLKGYRAKAIRIRLSPNERLHLDEIMTDLMGEAQPMGTVAHEFRDFSTYNEMIYDRAQVMYGQLRDVLGDSAFVEFLHDYYSRWALKHVDERAMRASAERVSGRDLGWFFDEWVHHTGVMDYALERVQRSRDASGAWVTDATVRRRGEYRHVISVGVRTARGWTLGGTASERPDRQTVRIVTTEEPLEVRLDPFHYSWDWDRRDDRERRHWFSGAPNRYNFDWPFLAQADREHYLSLWRPMAWYSDVGGANVGLRLRGNYLGWLDLTDFGAVLATRRSTSTAALRGNERFQFWERIENPTLGRRPAVGWRFGAASLDDVFKLDIGRRREISTARGSRSTDFVITHTSVLDERALVPELWSIKSTVDLAARMRWQLGRSDRGYWVVEPSGVAGVSGGDRYGKLEASLGRVHTISENVRFALRGYAAIEDGAPAQRGLYLSAADPVSTYDNHWWRPAGAILKRPGVNWLPLGGAALRGFHWSLAARNVAGGNVDASRRVATKTNTTGTLALWMHAFADVAHTDPHGVLSDAGAGLSVRGRLYDRSFTLRIDSPFFVNRPEFAIDGGRTVFPIAGGRTVRGQLAQRWVFAFNDIW